jgi:hypothetical protein
MIKIQNDEEQTAKNNGKYQNFLPRKSFEKVEQSLK